MYIWVKLLRDLLATQRLNQNIGFSTFNPKILMDLGIKIWMFPNHPVLGTHTSGASLSQVLETYSSKNKMNGN